MRTSVGFGTGLAVATTGTNVKFSPNVSKVRIKNLSTNPVYVVINGQISGGADTLNTGASVADPEVTPVSAADAVANGIEILQNEVVELIGHPFTFDPNIRRIALVSTGGAASVTGGVTDIS